MRYLAYHENAERGTFDFPVARYYVDTRHPRYEMPFHWHDECELIRMRQGTFCLSIAGTASTLQSGDCAFIPGGVIHGGRPQSAVYECLVLNMEKLLQGSAGRQTQYASALGNGAAIQTEFPANSEAGTVIGRLFEAMEKEQTGYEFLVTGLLWQWLGLVLGQGLTVAVEKPEPHGSDLKNALQRIRRDYASPMTLADLAAEANMTPLYFCRVFRQVTGRPPIDYLNYFRAECAAEMLCATDASVTDIALACGFSDPSYFIRLFRRYKGTSPGKYRKGRGNGNPFARHTHT